MIKVVTAAQMQVLDQQTIREAKVPGLTLMERAGVGVVSHLEQWLGSLRGKYVTIICGKGNNGGDGLVVARLLHRKGARARAVLLARPGALSPDAKTMYQRFVRLAQPSAIAILPPSPLIRTWLSNSDVIVDALLGTGLSSPVSGHYREAIELINESGRAVVAVDLPSGLHADQGMILGAAVRANFTITFGSPKLGLYVGAGIDHAGLIRIADIGIPQAFVERVESRIGLIDADMVKIVFPSRRRSSHKGTFGHAGIIAGSVGKTGSAALAANAALRMGAGLVTVATPSSVNDVLEAKLLEVMTVPMPETEARTLSLSGLDRLLTFTSSRTAVAVGPGLTTHPETVELVQHLVRQIDKPLLLDADALNALAGRTSLLTECKAPPVLTPHPGEMARLVTEATAHSINADRIGVASRFARERGVYLVLKGARTVIGRPDGMVAICPTGNPGMATAGTGDVLTGMIVGLLAQGVAPWDAACAATYLHGLSGDLAACATGEVGMTAGNLIEQIPQAIIQATGSS